MGLPLWLPGHCGGTTRIMLRQLQFHGERPALETPPTAEEYNSAFGPIRAVKVPHAIHDTMVKLELHRLGGYLEPPGVLELTKAALVRTIPTRTANGFIAWFAEYGRQLLPYLEEDVPG